MLRDLLIAAATSRFNGPRSPRPPEPAARPPSRLAAGNTLHDQPRGLLEVRLQRLNRGLSRPRRERSEGGADLVRERGGPSLDERLEGQKLLRTRFRTREQDGARLHHHRLSMFA